MGSRRGGGGADWPWAHGAQLRVCVLRVYCGRRWPRAPSGHPSARTGLCGILLLLVRAPGGDLVGTREGRGPRCGFLVRLLRSLVYETTLSVFCVLTN